MQSTVGTVCEKRVAGFKSRRRAYWAEPRVSGSINGSWLNLGKRRLDEGEEEEETPNGAASEAKAEEESAAPRAQGKESAMEAELRAAKERATIPLEVRMQRFRDMLVEKEVSSPLAWPLAERQNLAVLLLAGVRFLHLGKGAAQDSVRQPLPATHLQGAQTGI